MNLILYKKDGIDDQFVQYVIKYIRTLIPQFMYMGSVWKLQDFVNKQVATIPKRRIRLYDTILQGVYNIVYDEYNYYYIIHIDYNQHVPYYNDVSVYSMCKLINYGTMGIRGTGMFSQVMKQVSNDLEKLKEMYRMGVVIGNGQI